MYFEYGTLLGNYEFELKDDIKRLKNIYNKYAK